MAGQEVDVGVLAHCKILLHCLKYPHKAVNGLLLGEKKNPQHIVDIVPLCHLSLGLTPTLEIALLQVEAFCKRQNLVISGYYQANEKIDDHNLDGIATRIAEKILEVNGSCVLAIVQSRSLLNGEPFLVGYQPTNQETGAIKWRPLSNPMLGSGVPNSEQCTTLAQAKAFRTIVDFDNHLDDFNCDWTNQETNALIEQLVTVGAC